jgi:hypothetical protein
MMRAARHVAPFLFLVVGCKHPPPKPPPSPPPPVEEPPPPPPPKCESLEEKCVSKEDTRVAIAGTSLTMAPPAGWTYAHGPGGVMVVSSASAIAVEAVAVTDPKKPPRAQTLASVVEKLSVKFPKRKGKLDLPKKADKTTAIGSMKVAFYQLDGAVRESKKGPLLVFSTTLPEGPLLMGAGFVPEDDTTNADAAILKAVESISNAPPQPPPPPATPPASGAPSPPASGSAPAPAAAP